jgi:uncharacterized membrane protein YbhN (UPF0104 family)
VKNYVRIVGCLSLAAFVAWRLDWERFGAAFVRLDLRLWLLAVGIYVGAQVVSSMRWRLLAAAIGFSGSTLRYVGYYFVGMFCNLALPTSVGGDVVRAWCLANGDEARSKTGPSTRGLEAFLTVFAERLSGVLMLAMLACAAAPFCPVPLRGWVWVIVAVVGAGAVGGVYLLLRIPVPTGRGTGFRARLAGVAAAYRSRRRLLLGSALLSLVVQAGSVALGAVVGAALGLQVPLLYYAVMVPLVSLLTLLPVSISGMGLREMGYVMFLKPLGIDPAAAVGLGLLTFAATALPALGGGLVMMFGRFPRPSDRAGGVAVEVRSDDDLVGGDTAQRRARQSQAAA